MSTSASFSFVVGIDGSEGSLAALRWTLREAGSTGAQVTVVHCWGPHTLVDLALGSSTELLRGSTCMLHNEVTAALHDVATEPAVVVHEVSRRGRAAAVLVEFSARAQLLVIGTHRHRLGISALAGAH